MPQPARADNRALRSGIPTWNSTLKPPFFLSFLASRHRISVVVGLFLDVFLNRQAPLRVWSWKRGPHLPNRRRRLRHAHWLQSGHRLAPAGNLGQYPPRPSARAVIIGSKQHPSLTKPADRKPVRQMIRAWFDLTRADRRVSRFDAHVKRNSQNHGLQRVVSP